MFENFLLKVSNWLLEKEEEAAKNCALPLNEVEEQLKKLQEKKEELQQKCKKDIEVLDNLIERVEKIKNIEILKCGK